MKGPRRVAAEVLVVGSGPAGSSAAHVLATSGKEVALVDSSAFPRDKVCGDALIPDSLQAVARLGLRETLARQARFTPALCVYAPDHSHIRLRGDFAVLPRLVFDDLLRRAAVHAGAKFLAPYRALGPIQDDGRVIGARFANAHTQEPLEVTAPFTILATGAGPEPLLAFGVATRRPPSAVAARAYFRAEPSLLPEFDHLTISYDARICPGYGWIFPLPNRVFNVGVGYFLDGAAPPPTLSLGRLFREFVTSFPPARQITENAIQLSPLRGSPLRTAMSGSLLGRPGLVVAGDAAGMTYSFTGEGIGKAMQSGILAAEMILEYGSLPAAQVAVPERYAARLREEFGDRFRTYQTAQRWLGSPLICNLLGWRARRSASLRQRLEAIVNETADAHTVFSLPGLLKALLAS